MATIGDSFLADLDELSDNENNVNEEEGGNYDDMEEDIDGDMADIETLNYDDLDSVSKLQKTQRYVDIMQKMVEGASTIGLTWEPKIPSLTSSSGSRKLESSPQNLIDGLFVPPNDPRKLNKLIRKQRKDTTGSSWFDMPAPTITPEMKRDLQILKLRSALDPKRHYKKSDSKSKTLTKYFQVGTVIESASDFFSGRLTKKERKETLANELLADHSLTKYRKRKIREIEEQKRPAGVEKWKNKGRQSWKRAKDRRH